MQTELGKYAKGEKNYYNCIFRNPTHSAKLKIARFCSKPVLRASCLRARFGKKNRAQTLRGRRPST